MFLAIWRQTFDVHEFQIQFLADIEIESMHFVQDRSLVHVNVGKIWILLWKYSVGFMSVLFVGLTKGTFYCQIAIVILCRHFLYTQKSPSQLYEWLVFTIVFLSESFLLSYQ